MTSEIPDEDRTSRRAILAGAGGIVAFVAAGDARAASSSAGASPNHLQKGHQAMTAVTTNDGTQIFYKDWGSGRPIVFSHGWPLTADAWDSQMLFLAGHGFRVIAHDRRGHGRSDQPSGGNDMDTYADDLATLVEALNLRGMTLVGHSTGGGEVARYIARHGDERVAKTVLIGAVPPFLLQSEANPNGAPLAVFDGIRSSIAADRAQFYRDLAMPFYGYNKPGAKPSQGVIDSFWQQGMLGGIKGQYECIKAFSETDFTADLRKIEGPTLLLHGDADQIVPLAISSERSAKLLRNPTLKVYEGGPHGMCTTLSERVNADLLAFAKA